MSEAQCVPFSLFSCDRSHGWDRKSLRRRCKFSAAFQPKMGFYADLKYLVCESKCPGLFFGVN